MNELIKEINDHLKKQGFELTENSIKRDMKDIQFLADTARFFPINFDKVFNYLGFSKNKIERSEK